MFDKTAIGTIIIPAYNESAVLGRTLDALCGDMTAEDFDLIIVCNGCSDATAEVARVHAPNARVVEIEKPSKTGALNVALGMVSEYPVVFLDADIETTTASVQNLIYRLNWSGALLAYGSVSFETKECSPLVRAFYRAWRQNPYFDQQKMGGMFAVSRAGLEELQAFPDTTNDDEYVRRSLMHNTSWAQQAIYKVRAPRSIKQLIKVRSRVYRGNQELEQSFVALGEDGKRGNSRLFLHRLVCRPNLWLGAAIFAFVALVAHARNKVQARTGTPPKWEQDNSTRQGV